MALRKKVLKGKFSKAKAGVGKPKSKAPANAEKSYENGYHYIDGNGNPSNDPFDTPVMH